VKESLDTRSRWPKGSKAPDRGWNVTGSYDPSSQLRSILSRGILITVQGVLGLETRNMEDVFGMFRSVTNTARGLDGNNRDREKGDDEPKRRFH